MKGRQLAGGIISFLGLIILLVCSFFGMEAFLVSLIYGAPLIIIGIIILFNKKEDKIEEINYSKIKGGSK